MALNAFPERVRQFVFQHIDSVEQLEVLLFMRTHRDACYDALGISAQLRSNPQSVLKRLLILEGGGLLKRHETLNTANETLLFQFDPRNPEIQDTIDALAEVYKQKPQRIFELIFSPLKKGRQFAAAFIVTPPKKDTNNG